MQDLVTYCDV